MHLGGERHCESKVSCPRTQQCPRPGLKPGLHDPEMNTLTIHPCHTAAILDIVGMKSKRCVANLRFAAINHAKQRFQCALMCPCAQITDQKVN